MAHYTAAMDLWQQSEGVGLSAADESERIAAYLQRNPDLSFVALDENELVGAVLCGHDGRRGFIHHLAVRRAYRRQGIGRTLAERCLTALGAEGIDKCHLFVVADNAAAITFWRSLAWVERVDLTMMSKSF